jgi:DNA-binding protein YbaB
MHHRIAEVQRMAAELTAEAVSPDGAVRVVAGPAGEVKQIDQRLSAFELSGVELGEVTAAAVKTATSAADRELAARVRGLMSDVFEAEREANR